MLDNFSSLKEFEWDFSKKFFMGLLFLSFTLSPSFNLWASWKLPFLESHLKLRPNDLTIGEVELKQAQSFLKAIKESPLAIKARRELVDTWRVGNAPSSFQQVPYHRALYITLFSALRKHLNYSSAEAMMISSYLLKRYPPYYSYLEFVKIIENNPQLWKHFTRYKNEVEQARELGFSTRELMAHKQRVKISEREQEHTAALIRHFVFHPKGLGVILERPRHLRADLLPE
jgi:hypothetical protein